MYYNEERKAIAHSCGAEKSRLFFQRSMSRIKYRLLQCISFFCPASQWFANLIGQLHLVACAQAVRFPSGSRVRNAPKFPIMATFQAFYYTMKQRKKDSLNTLKTFKAFSLIAFGARNGLHQI